MGGEVDAALRPLLPRRHALRDGLRPAALRRRRDRRDHRPAPQHAAGRAVLAPPRLPAGARGADPAPAGEGPVEAPSVGDRGARGARSRSTASTAAPRQRLRRDLPARRRTRSTAAPSSAARTSCKQLQQAFDAALSGQGGLVMVVGEPGIGKTALCEQLATYVALRGGKALVGHCYEEGSLSLPYLAFVEAMRSYVLAREPDGLRSDLGTGAADVARIVSEVRDRVQGVELRPAGDPEDDRWRLLQAVTSFLRNASTVQPLLHRARRPALGRPRHARPAAARRAQPAGRAAAHRRHLPRRRGRPLAPALGDAGRAAAHRQLPARAVCAASPSTKCSACIEAIRGQEVAVGAGRGRPPPDRGQPAVRPGGAALPGRGRARRARGRALRRRRRRRSAPASPRACATSSASACRASSEKCNRLLAVAAVIGRDFRLDVLQQVAGLPEEELLRGARGGVASRRARGAVSAGRVRLPLRARLLPPDAVRGDDRAAPPAPAPAGGAGAGGAVRAPARGARRRAGRALRAVHRPRPTWRRRSSTASWRRSARCSVFAYGEAARHLEQASRCRRCSTRTTRRSAATCCSRWARRCCRQENPQRAWPTVARRGLRTGRGSSAIDERVASPSHGHSKLGGHSRYADARCGTL